MEETCRKKECANWELYGEGKCPNYIESWWTPNPMTGGEPKLIADCAPRRTFLMIQDLHNRLVGVERSQEQMRNEVIWVEAVASIIGKNTGLDLERFVEERQRIQRIKEDTIAVEYSEE
jgi:hypothetical protein